MHEEDLGVIHSYRNDAEQGFFTILESLGGGIGLLDIDQGDGRQDFVSFYVQRSFQFRLTAVGACVVVISPTPCRGWQTLIRRRRKRCTGLGVV